MENQERVLSSEDDVIQVHITVDLKKTEYAKFREAYDKSTERELFSRVAMDVLREMNGGHPDLMAYYLERQNKRNHQKHVFDRIELEEKQITVIKTMSEAQGLDAVRYVADDLLADYVQGMLNYWSGQRPKEVKKLRVTLKRKDLDLPHDAFPLLAELGIHFNRAHVLKTLAEWEEQSLEAFCKQGIIATLEGRIKNPEIIGNIFSERLKDLLK
jgi:hypothetical protein